MFIYANLDWLTNQSYQATHEHDNWQRKLSVQVSDEEQAAVRGVRHYSVSSDSDEEDHQQKKAKKHRKRKRAELGSSDEARKRSKHKRKDKKKKHKQKEKITKNLHETEKNKPDTIWIEESGLAPEEAYRVYRKPDVQNLIYGSLYRLDVASYKIKSNILCLGLHKNQSLILNEKKKKKDKKKDMDSRYWRDIAALSEAPKRVQPSKSTSQSFVGNVENFSYIPIDLPSSRDEDDEDDDKKSDNIENVESNIDPTERIISQRTTELNKILRENPHDVKTWIELANFQAKAVNKEDVARVTFTVAGNERKKKHSKIISEKQISVLEKALELNPSSIELITYHLELCNDWWNGDKLVERWRKVVFSHPNKTILWRKYLLFLQSRVSTFTFRKVQKAYDKCFTTLLSIKEGTFVSHQAEAGIEEEMLDLFVQQCNFMKQSGHMEKSVASFQAMIELNCLCPDELSTNTLSAGLTAFLETFWDSGQPRFGESGALGWKTWMDKTTTDKKPLALESLDFKKIFKSCHPSHDNETEDTAEKEEELIKGLHKWEAWLKVEVSREQTQLKPWQPDQATGETEDDCEDPERIIIFDDISSSLFKLCNPPNKFKLILCFLEMLGVPSRPLSSSQSSDIHRYFELSVESLQQVLNQSDFNVHGIGWQRYGYWYNTRDKTRMKPSFETLQLVRNIFVQSISLFEGDSKNYLITTWLQYEFYLTQLESLRKARKQKLKEVYKLAKAILKEPSNRNNFQVWEVFAQITALSGDTLEARHMFDSTLSLGSQLAVNDANKRITLAPLYRSCAEMELKQAMESNKSSPVNHNRLLHLLVSFAENNQYEPAMESIIANGVSSAKILRAKRTYSELCHDSIRQLNDCPSEDNKKVLSCVHCIVCCALFAYVSSGIQAAVAVYEQVLSSLSSPDDSLHHEHLWTSYFCLLKMHTKQETMSLRTVKQAIHRAISIFPNNPFFLDYYHQVELKSNLTGEVRRFFDHLTHSATTPIPWIYAIHYEDMRAKATLSAIDCSDYRVSAGDGQSAGLVTSLPTTGISHRQRALFDRATSSVAGRQCIGLWRMYMEFELNQGNQEQAKAVFYQALQNCAWAKTLYLDAIKAFPDDLQNTVDMMEEKELRVRTPLEEIDILMEE
ncbi:hypothetical protein QZH41_020706, partial [Actinostola sp. cb2023]